MQLLKKLGAVAVALVMATATILPMVSVDVSALTDEGITDADLAAIENEKFDYCYDVQRSFDTDSSGETTIESDDADRPRLSDGMSTTNPNETGLKWTLTKKDTYGALKDNNVSTDALDDIIDNIIMSEYGSELTAKGMDKNNIVIHELKKGTESIGLGVIVAYGLNLNDSNDANKYISFIGNRNNGYILSNKEYELGSFGNNCLKAKLSANMVATAEYTPGNTNPPSVDDDQNDDPTTEEQKPVEKPAEPAKDKTPNTGDESNATAWMAILMLSGAALAGLGVNRKFNAN